MKELDFRPEWYGAARKRRRNVVIRATLLGVLAGELALGSLGVFARKAEAQQALDGLRSAAIRQDIVHQDLRKHLAILDRLREKRKLLTDVTGGAPAYAVLAELSTLTPRDMVMTTIRLTENRRVGHATLRTNDVAASAGDSSDSEGGKLTITGLAPSDSDIGTLLSNLARSAMFRKVTLRYAKPLVMGTLAAREFELTCVVPQFE